MNRRKFLSTTAKAAGVSLLSYTSIKAENKHNWQIGIYTRPWGKHSYQTAFDAMAEVGFKYAGLMTHKKGLVVSVKTKEKTAHKIGEEAKQRGLLIISVYGGDFHADRSVKAGVRGLKKLIDNVAACNGRNLLLGGVTKRKVFNDYYRAVRESCDYAAEQGVVLTLKPHGGLNATGPQCRKIIEMINHPNFQLWYDPGNIYYYSDGMINPTKDVESVADIVAGVCIKDFKRPKDVLVTPGTGMVDFPILFAKLKSGGFTGGPLVIECLNPGSPEATREQAGQAKSYLERLLT